MRVTQMSAMGKESGRGKRTQLSAMPAIVGENKGTGIDIKKILSRFEKDDYILAGLIIVLVLEGCEDYLLLAALGYLFIMGLKE